MRDQSKDEGPLTGCGRFEAYLNGGFEAFDGPGGVVESSEHRFEAVHDGYRSCYFTPNSLMPLCGFLGKAIFTIWHALKMPEGFSLLVIND